MYPYGAYQPSPVAQQAPDVALTQQLQMRQAMQPQMVLQSLEAAYLQNPTLFSEDELSRISPVFEQVMGRPFGRDAGRATAGDEFMGGVKGFVNSATFNIPNAILSSMGSDALQPTFEQKGGYGVGDIAGLVAGVAGGAGALKLASGAAKRIPKVGGLLSRLLAGGSAKSAAARDALIGGAAGAFDHEGDFDLGGALVGAGLGAGIGAYTGRRASRAGAAAAGVDVPGAKPAPTPEPTAPASAPAPAAAPAAAKVDDAVTAARREKVTQAAASKPSKYPALNRLAREADLDPSGEARGFYNRLAQAKEHGVSPEKLERAADEYRRAKMTVASESASAVEKRVAERRLTSLPDEISIFEDRALNKKAWSAREEIQKKAEKESEAALRAEKIAQKKAEKEAAEAAARAEREAAKQAQEAKIGEMKATYSEAVKTLTPAQKKVHDEVVSLRDDLGNEDINAMREEIIDAMKETVAKVRTSKMKLVLAKYDKKRLSKRAAPAKKAAPAKRAAVEPEDDEAPFDPSEVLTQNILDAFS